MCRIISSAAVSAALLLAAPAIAKEKAPPPEPATHPDWTMVRETAESSIKSALFDPTSAQIAYTSGFQWGYTKPTIGSRRWGWVACGNINAKNRLGGYVGATPFTIYSDAAGNVFAVMDADVGTCTNGQKVPVNPDLQNQADVRVNAGTAIGVAAELEKLADLKANGIITQAEFNSQKAKLLAR